METYTLEELTPEEAQNLTKELQEVLTKYHCEMGVKAVLEIKKRVEVDEPTKSESTPSPYAGDTPESPETTQTH